MYLDAKRLQFTTRSLDLARASSSSKWEKNNEDLNFGCTAKGNIVGSINVNFMIGITYNKTVVLGKHYKKYNNITKNGTNNKRCNERGFGKQHWSESQKNPSGWLPPTKFKTGAKSTWYLKYHQIPSKQVLKEQTESDTWDKSTQRVQSVMIKFSIVYINKIIESMSFRIDMAIKENRCSRPWYFVYLHLL